MGDIDGCRSRSRGLSQLVQWQRRGSRQSPPNLPRPACHRLSRDIAKSRPTSGFGDGANFQCQVTSDGVRASVRRSCCRRMEVLETPQIPRLNPSATSTHFPVLNQQDRREIVQRRRCSLHEIIPRRPARGTDAGRLLPGHLRQRHHVEQHHTAIAVGHEPPGFPDLEDLIDARAR